MLYDFCRSHGVGHSRLGKLIVATEDVQIPALRSIEAHARANGVADIAWLEGKEAIRMEPALRAVAALHSPSTGIVDSHGYMLALQGDAEAAGAALAFHSPLRGARLRSDGRIELDVGGDNPLDLVATHVVNSAGLQAQAVAHRIEGLAPATVPAGAMAKGSYFSFSGRAPFSRLIYPLPGFTGLGVHLTLDLGGKARFGPDAQMVTAEDYAVDPERGRGFYQAVRRYWPDLPDNSLQPDYSGIRPVLQGTGGAKVDFVIQGPAEHGAKGLINLYGIESPGLTASLAIAEQIAAMIDHGDRRARSDV
jgi:L-2-hydroxyglutarate oxidase LhgO